MNRVFRNKHSVCAIFFVVVLFGQSVAAQNIKKPPVKKLGEERVSPASATYLTDFTLKATSYFVDQIARNFHVKSTYRAVGSKYPNFGCDLSFPMREGSRARWHRTGKGIYENGADDTLRFGKIDQYGGIDPEDVSFEVIEDILGADAVSNIQKVTAETMRAKDEGSERAMIVDALAKSKENLPQAANRLHMKEGVLVEKMRKYGINGSKQ